MSQSVGRRKMAACLSVAVAVASLTGWLPIGEGASAPEKAAVAPTYLVKAAYPAWRMAEYAPEQIPLDLIHQVSHVFIWPDTDGSLVIPNGFLLPDLNEQVHAAGKEILIGVGGAERDSNFATVAADPAKRAVLVDALTAFVVEYQYDGVDMDWEFPESNEDRQNLTLFMSELKASLDATGQDLQLNIAIPGGEQFGQWFDAAAIAPLVNHFVLMAYGMHGPWSSESGHCAPLYSPPLGLEPGASVDAAVRYWRETRGVAPSKILLGVPFFGISFDSEDLYQPFTTFDQASYRNIQPLVGEGYTRHWDEVCQVPYLTQNDGPILWSYDDPESIALKCDYAIANDMRGVAIWEITGDRIGGQQILLQTIVDKLISTPTAKPTDAPTPTPAPTNAIPPPWSSFLPIVLKP